MEVTTRVCDMEAGHAAGPATQRQFSLDGQEFEIDLCARHDQPFMDMIDKWAQASRPGAKLPARQGRRTHAQRERSAAIRAWAKATGKHMEDGGRLPVSVVREYDQAHGS